MNKADDTTDSNKDNNKEPPTIDCIMNAAITFIAIIIIFGLVITLNY